MLLRQTERHESTGVTTPGYTECQLQLSWKVLSQLLRHLKRKLSSDWIVDVT